MTWVQITCKEREALVDSLGRSFNGFSTDSGISVTSSLTDVDGEYGDPHIFTEWGRGDHGTDPVLQDERWPGCEDCEHRRWIP